MIDGDTGFLCDTNAQFTAACLALAHDPVLRAHMSANARALVQRHFSLARLRRELAPLFGLPLAG